MKKLPHRGGSFLMEQYTAKPPGAGFLKISIQRDKRYYTDG